MTSSAPGPQLKSGASVLLAAQALRAWTARQVLVAVISGIAIAVVIGVATVLIPNQLFSREIAPVWWNYPVWLATSALSGILMASYVRTGSTDVDARRSSRMGMVGGILAWFAIGCPVCNKLAVLALGYSGAISWFAPVQPLLAVCALILTAIAVVWRLRGQVSCSVRPSPAAAVR